MRRVSNVNECDKVRHGLTLHMLHYIFHKDTMYSYAWFSDALYDVHLMSANTIMNVKTLWHQGVDLLPESVTLNPNVCSSLETKTIITMAWHVEI